jgi:PAS domain S-box-containing protein
MIALAVAGAAQLRDLGGRVDRIFRENYTSVVAVERLNESLERIDSSFQFALAGQTAAARGQYEANWPSYQQAVRRARAHAKLPGEGEAVRQLTALTDRYRTQGDAFFAREIGDPQRGRAYFGRGGLLDVFKGIKSAADEIRRLNEDQMQRASGNAERTATLSVNGLASGLVLSLVLGAFLVWSTSRTIVAPVKALTRSALAVSRGNLDEGVTYTAEDELGELARAFNRMVAELRAAQEDKKARSEELRRAEENYRSIFEHAVEGAFQTTPGGHGRFITANQSLAAMLGYASPDELVNSVSDIGEQVYADPGQRSALAERLAREEVVRGFETTWVRKDGSTVPLSLNIRTVAGRAGADHVFYEGFATDVTARKQAEQEVNRLAHLHAVVAELSQRALRLDPAADIEKEVAERVAMTLDVDFVNVMQRLPDGAFLLRAGVGWKPGLVGKARVAGNGTQPDYTLRSDRAVISEDPAHETRFAPVAHLLGESAESSVSVVVTTREGAYGTLGAHSRRRRSFARDEVDFLRSVANVLGAVVERRRAERALSASEANLNRAQEIAHIGSWRFDIARNRFAWSEEMFRIFGVAPDRSLTYDEFLSAVHPDDRERVGRAWSAALGGAVYDIEHRIVVPDAAGADGSARPERVKWVRERAELAFDESGKPVEAVGTVQDVTERHTIEEQLRRSNRALRAVSSCDHALVRATDEFAYMGEVCRLIVEEAGYRLCWVGLAEHDPKKSVRPIAHAGFADGYLERLDISWGDTERGQGPTGTCIRESRVVVSTDIATDARFALWRDAALQRGYASSIAIPIGGDGGPIGALSIYAAEPGAFAETEVTLLTELTEDLSYGVAALRTRAERDRVLQQLRALNTELEIRVARRTADLEAAYEREANVGARIQQQLLLDEPPKDVPGLALAALTVPSQRIAGDFYGFFRHEEQDCLDLFVADVMGKGVPAALLGAATKNQFPVALFHLLDTAPGRALPEPHDIVTFADAQVAHQLIDIETFVTLCYTRIDTAKRRLDVVDCGHTGVLHQRGARTEVLHGDNLPLGIREGEIYGQFSVPIESGDVLVYYSDGVTEARNAGGEMFGIARLSDCLRENEARDPVAIVRAIRDTVVAFSGSRTLADDLTCVVAKLAPYDAPLSRAVTTIASTLGELHRARQFVARFCATLPGGPLPEDAAASLVLAVNEAASNIMKHAYQGRADQRIDIMADGFADRVEVSLRYLGLPFDRSEIPPPALDGSRESGFGVFLIEKSVDAVRYFTDDLRRSGIRLVKRRKRT